MFKLLKTPLLVLLFATSVWAAVPPHHKTPSCLNEFLGLDQLLQSLVNQYETEFLIGEDPLAIPNGAIQRLRNAGQKATATMHREAAETIAAEIFSQLGVKSDIECESNNPACGVAIRLDNIPEASRKYWQIQMAIKLAEDQDFPTRIGFSTTTLLTGAAYSFESHGNLGPLVALELAALRTNWLPGLSGHEVRHWVGYRRIQRVLNGKTDAPLGYFSKDTSNQGLPEVYFGMWGNLAQFRLKALKELYSSSSWHTADEENTYEYEIGRYLQNSERLMRVIEQAQADPKMKQRAIVVAKAIMYSIAMRIEYLAELNRVHQTLTKALNKRTKKKKVYFKHLFDEAAGYPVLVATLREGTKIEIPSPALFSKENYPKRGEYKTWLVSSASHMKIITEFADEFLNQLKQKEMTNHKQTLRLLENADQFSQALEKGEENFRLVLLRHFPKLPFAH